MSQIFFDIETGGFGARKSQIFSLAYARNQDKVTPLGAQLEQGTTLSRWSENKIWEPLKTSGLRLQKEREVLSGFLKVLETAPAGTQLVGWNIGYVPVPQQANRAGGFDVSFLMSRARHYGMEAEYRSAFRRHEFMDLGSTWAYRIAREAAGETGEKLVQEGAMHPTLQKEAVGYMKQAYSLAAEQGLTKEADIAEALSRANVRFAGWKQELVYEISQGKPLAGAHEAAADVRALQEIYKTGGKADEAFLRKWSPMALRNKLVSRAKYIPEHAAEAIPARYTGIMAEAKQWGMREDVENTLRSMAKESGVSFEDVKAGRGISRLERTVRGESFAEVIEKLGKGGFGEFVDEFTPFVRRHAGKIAIGASIAAAMIFEPGSLFSGSDDEYNTIEGLRHGGQAQEMRKMLTDFGSGWIRTALSKGISREKIAGAAAKLGTGKSGLGAKEFSEEILKQWQGGAPQATKFIREAQGITVENQRWIYGKRLGAGQFGEAWTATRAGGKAQAGVVKTLKDPKTEPLTELAGRLQKDPHAKPKDIPMTPGLGDQFRAHMYGGEEKKASDIWDFGTAYMQQIAGHMNKHKLTSLQYEAKMTKLAREQAGPNTFVPEVFAVSPTAMVQEVAGKGVSDLPTTRAKGLAKFLQAQPGKQLTTEKGIIHLDPHHGNVVRRGANYAMIDYGLAIAADPKTQKAREKIFAPAYEKYVKKVRAQADARPAFTGTEVLPATTGTPLIPGPPPPVMNGTATGVARPKAMEKAAKAGAIAKTNILSNPGPATTNITKKLTDFGSPVNLNKAVNRASEMLKQTRKVVSKPKHSILEPSQGAAKRKARMNAKHRQSVVRSSSNSLRPGRRHRQKTGSIVQ